MHYVYILKSTGQPGQWYTGMTDDLRSRLEKHNAGQVFNTARYAPWQVHWYCAFASRQQAAAFEAYLKTGSGRAFAAKRLR